MPIHPQLVGISWMHKCVFVGYSPGMAGYRLIDVEDMKLTIRRDVTFDETRLGLIVEACMSKCRKR